MLKFGGSVLTNDATLRLAVDEIYRWRRRSHRVVAVVSALAGVTDSCSGSASGSPAGRPRAAAVVSTGEMQSAALGAAPGLRRGVGRAVGAGGDRMVAEGPPLDATPTDCRPRRCRAPLDRDDVVVVPGYLPRTLTAGRVCSAVAART